MLTACLDTIKKELAFDIGFGDVIVPSPILMTYPTIINGMDNPRLVAYSLETVLAEKIQTMVEKGVFNSRMKDFFDVYRVIHVHEFDADILLEALKATFTNRNTDYSTVQILFTPEFTNNESLDRRWNAYCKKIKPAEAPSFKETIRIINEFLLPYSKKMID